ncbi:MAG: MFS transporter [Oscillospiraceae bacterium]|jgi:Na+/melibiose symporter-like transporter|nr:MFS transporter [Oscillospiraceae bacterium]
MDKKRVGYHYTPIERRTLYLSAFGLAIFTSVTGLFSAYLTDIGVAAAIVSVILLITRVWDFVNDPIAGMIIERARFKGGKYKPWLKASTLLLPAAGFLMFLPNGAMPLYLKVILPTALFVIYEGVFTFLDIPIFGIRLVSTDSVQERTDLSSYLGLAAGLGLLLGSAAFPQLRPMLGWPRTVGISAILALLTTVWYPRVAVERFSVKQSEPTFREMVRAIGRNRQFLIYYGSLFICMSTNFVQVIGLYTARHVFGDERILTPLLLIMLSPALVVAIFIPRITKRVDKFDLFRLSLVGFALTGVVSYYAGYGNMTVVMTLMAFRGVFLGVSSLLAYVFTSDMVEWHHYLTGERTEAVSFSFQTLTAKTITALLSVLMMAILAALGFVEGEGAAQPQSVVSGIWSMFTWIPSVGALASLIGFHFYEIRDNKVQIMIRCNHGEITREDAERQLQAEGGYRHG